MLKFFASILSLLFLASEVFASPFIVSDPNPVAIGGKYELWEITAAHPEGVLLFSAPSEQDGSMKIDLNSVEKGTHNYRINYVAWSVPSEVVFCTLQSTLLVYSSVTKSFKSYSVTKGWTLKVPPTTSVLIPKMVD